VYLCKLQLEPISRTRTGKQLQTRNDKRRQLLDARLAAPLTSDCRAYITSCHVLREHLQSSYIGDMTRHSAHGVLAGPGTGANSLDKTCTPARRIGYGTVSNSRSAPASVIDHTQAYAWQRRRVGVYTSYTA